MIDPSAEPANTDDIKLFVEVKHQTTGPDKLENIDISASVPYRRMETSADGKKIITYLIEDQTADTASFNWTTHPDNNTITGNETFTLLLKQKNKDITAGCPVKIGDTYYSVTYDTGIVEGKNRVIDDDNDITTITHFINLKEASYEDAIDPYDVLGEGAEYGIVANKYIQKNDSETNFAVNVFENPDTIQLKVGEKGSAVDLMMPFYVGRIDSGKLRLGSDTTVGCDVYINNSQQDKITKDGGSFELNKIPMAESDINQVVNGYINKLKASSAEYAAKTTFTPVYSGGQDNRNIDTTMFPDNITIYVDASNMDLARGGGLITKLPGQTIVFNIPDERVMILCTGSQ